MKNKLIYPVGQTADGRAVVAGLMRFRETYGLPIDNIFEILEGRGYVVSWQHLIAEADAIGIKRDRFLPELRTAIIDVYGKEYADKVWTALFSAPARPC